MATTIERLRDLQECDLVIYRLKKRLVEIPAEITRYKDEFQKETEALANLDKEVKKEEVVLKETELEINSLEEGIKKARRQLTEVKTNKEYTALNSEIEGFRKTISSLEEHALTLMDNVARAKKKRKEEEKRLEKEKGLLDEKVKLMARDEAETREKFSEEEKRRPILSGAVPREMLAAYERVLKAKPNRRALAGVKDSTCAGCHTRLPTGILDQLHKGGDLVFCEGCNRLLYLE